MDAFSKVILKILGIKKIVSISIIEKGDIRIIVGLILQKKDDEVKIIDKSTFQNFDELNSWLSTYNQYPIVIVLDGDHILSSVGERNNLADQTDFVNFEHQYENSDFQVVFRNDYLETIMAGLKVKATDIIAVYGGIIPAIRIYPLLQNYGYHEPKIGNFKILQSGTQFEIADSKTERFSIEEEQISSDEMYAYASAICFWLDLKNKVYTNGIIPEKFIEKIHQSIYKKLIVYLPASILILLLCNFLLFNNLSQRNTLLKESVNEEQRIFERSQILTKNIEQLSSKLNINQPEIYNANKIDDIGSTIPSSIKLSSLVISPKKTDKSKRSTTFDNEHITVKGSSKNVSAYSKWLGQVKLLDWVIEIEGQQFKRNNQSGFPFDFTLNLRIK